MNSYKTKFPSDWTKLRISDIGDVVGGGTPSTKVERYYGGEIPWITPRDLSNHDEVYIEKGERNITEEGLFNSSTRLMPEGTILFTSRAPIGYVAIAKNKISTNQGFKSIICNQTADNKFVYYWLKQNKDNIERFASGSTFKEISGTVLKNIEIILPSYYEQKEIAKILFSLDSKAEMNRQMNKTLESIVQVIFKHWFIDFEFPNEDGKPYKSSGGEMICNEGLGKEIPRGWKVISLKSQINIKHGYAFKGENFCDYPTKYVLLTPGNFAIGGGFKADKLRFYEGEVMDEYVLHDGDLLITMTDLSKMGDTLGYPAIVPKNHEKIFLHNQRLGKVEISSDSYLTLPFLYCLMCRDDYRGEILGSATGTTVKHTSPSRILSYQFVLPSKELIVKFDKISKSIFNSIDLFQYQINSLKSIRDLLLPKLMSGKIRIPFEARK